ncbi:hypothetical protein [Methanogenium organophilum]|uniref:Uncharacterized protein n=1 Tax=Methanogenium organophilum TaxID=2199 RepID=A0A9X9T6V6_METOG|nr:hypothetical protein [Methanogenium organophilum]WAI00399.1 hypothetical protein OU421_08140 [Methanogenium organophilum]
MRKTEPKINRNHIPDPHSTPIALPIALPVVRENRIAEETRITTERITEEQITEEQIAEEKIAEEQNRQIMPEREVRTCNPQTENR